MVVIEFECIDLVAVGEFFCDFGVFGIDFDSFAGELFVVVFGEEAFGSDSASDIDHLYWFFGAFDDEIESGEESFVA